MQQTNLEEYSEPTLYDTEKRDFSPDGPFYLALAQQFDGPVLDLGCGTGRITIPLAQHGVDITGLDVVPGMLALARQKSAGISISWIEADARTFRLNKTFRLIFESGGVFQHLLTREDQEAFLARVHEHLEENGVFVVGVFFPRPDLMGDAEEHDWFSYTTDDGRHVQVSGTERYDRVTQVLTETAYRRWQDDDGQQHVHYAPLDLRMVYPQELEDLLHYNGFDVAVRYGNWDRSVLTSDSRTVIYVCRKSAYSNFEIT